MLDTYKYHSFCMYVCGACDHIVVIVPYPRDSMRWRSSIVRHELPLNIEILTPQRAASEILPHMVALAESMYPYSFLLQISESFQRLVKLRASIGLVLTFCIANFVQRTLRLRLTIPNMSVGPLTSSLPPSPPKTQTANVSVAGDLDTGLT